MERTLVENTQGEIFSCTNCGNTEFEQDCYVKSTEIVNIKRQLGVLTIVSKTMYEISEDQIEYNNSFTCPKCNTQYEIITRDGVDTIYNVTEDQQNE
jgi:transcription elongation factor Elf1